MEVGSKAVPRSHSIVDARGRNDCIGTVAKIVDEGEERRDVISEGLGRVKVSDQGPERGCYVPLFAADNCPP